MATDSRPLFSPGRAFVGFISGLLGGLGASVAVTQSGRVTLTWLFGLPLAAALLTGLWAGVRTPRWFDRFVQLIVLGSVVIAFVTSARPVLAQESTCSITVESDRAALLGGRQTQSVVAEMTSREVPWTVRLVEGQRFVFTVTAPGDFDGWARIRLAGFDPEVFPTQGAVEIWRGQITSGLATGTVDVAATGIWGAELVSAGVRSLVPPVGAARLQGEVIGGPPGACEPIELWIRIVDEPLGNPLGLAGLGALVIGAGAAAAAGQSPRPLTPSEWPAGRIPAGGPHSTPVESRFLDERGRPLDPSEALRPGGSYRLEVRITPGLSDRQSEAETDRITIRLLGRSFTVDRPRLTLDLGIGPAMASFPIRAPDRPGRDPLHMAVLHQGQVVQLETLDVTVGEGRSAVPHQTSTTITTGDFSHADLARRTPRAAQLLLLRGPDDTVDIDILGPDGERLVTFDDLNQAEAILAAAATARSGLVSILEGTPARPGIGRRLDAGIEDLRFASRDLARVGALLHDTMFKGATARHDPGTPARLGDIVRAGAAVQVNQDAAGVGVATLPWGLVYDRPLFATDASTLCPTYAQHPPDACPERDPGVVCPWGFWGFRYILEQPPGWPGREPPPPLPITIASRAPVLLNYVTEPAFPRQAPHLTRLEAAADLDVAVSTTLAEVVSAWQQRPDGYDIVHFFTHHGPDPLTGVPSLVVGGDHLTETHLRALDLTWRRHPLVIMAGCATGASHHLAAPSSLINAFRECGAAGVIGTECTVRDTIADALVAIFAEDVFLGIPIGTALLGMRRRVLLEHHNPAGLAYSLYASSDLHLAVPVSRPGGTQ